jgi:hypothetical protein
MMNERIYKLAEQAGGSRTVDGGYIIFDDSGELERFVDLIKQAIYDEVKEELVEDELINRHRDSLVREYLKGNNSGIVDALNCIKNFGKDIEE